MKVLEHLACSLDRRDEVPNQELAKEIAARNDRAAVKLLVEALGNQGKDIQNDCIKVLYETGNLKPQLIAKYAQVFVQLLTHKNNRLQWGAMSALSVIAAHDPKTAYGSLGKIVAAAESGSVITRDHAVKILVSLAAVKAYAKDALPLLREQLIGCPNNQLGMYAELIAPILVDKDKKIFIATLASRLHGIEKDSQRKRVEKVIRKLS